MKRVLPFLVFILCFLFLGTHHVLAASQDAGSLSGIVDAQPVVQSAVGFASEWVAEYVTSTFTGTVTTVSIVAKGGYVGTDVPMYVDVINRTTLSPEGVGFTYLSSMCDDSHDIVTSSTDCIVTFTLDNPVSVSTGDSVSMLLNTFHQSGGNGTHFYIALQPRTTSWSSALIHVGNSGSGNTYSWDDWGGEFASTQFAWAWNYNSSTPDTPPPCTENCNDNILFLPGIEGSRLYDEDGKLWEPSSIWSDDNLQKLSLNTHGSSTRDDIYTKDLIDETASGTRIYKSILEDLQGLKNDDLIAQYATAPYDWRLSMDGILGSGHQTGNGRIYYDGSYLSVTSTPFILEQLRTLAQTSRTGKVTIIAHSYGGLVAKELMRRLQTSDPELLSKIDNLVLVAVPQTGTPEAIGAGLHGFDVGIPFDSPFDVIISQLEARAFASTTPMLYNLLPSENYFTDSGAGSHVSTPPVTFVNGTTTQIFTDVYGSQITGTAELYNFLLGYEGRAQAGYYDLRSPSILSSSLLYDAENLHSMLDSWTPSTSTNVYQIAGWGMDTLGFIEYADHHTIVGDYLDYYPIPTVDGDDTVVVPSALAMSTSTSNVQRYWLNLRDYGNSTTTQRVHKDIFEVPELRSFIINNIITHSTTTLPEFITSDQPNADPGDVRLQFFLHSPLKLAAHDENGHEISSVTSTLRNAVYRRFGEVQYISLPASSTPTLTLTGYASGSFTLEIKEVVGDHIIASTTFSGIPTTTSTRATMQFLDGNIEHAGSLKVDTDGNSSVDLSIAPKMNDIVDPETVSEFMDNDSEKSLN